MGVEFPSPASSSRAPGYRILNVGMATFGMHSEKTTCGAIWSEEQWKEMIK